MGELFDDVARTLATMPSRRKAFTTIGGALAAAAMVNMWPRAANAATCPPGQVACGAFGICCGGNGFVCCGGSCCQTGQCTNLSAPTTAICCGGGQTVCAGKCCAPNEQCQSGACVRRGQQPSGGAAGGCAPGHTACGSTCCDPGGSCCNGATGMCCAPNLQCVGGACVARGAPSGAQPPGGAPQQRPPTPAR